MINKLLFEIKNYIEYLEKNKLYVSIHTNFSEYMLPLIEFNSHKNPKCLLEKSDNDNWNKCIKLHNSDIGEQADVNFRICHAGVEEAVFFLACGGTVCISTSGKFDKERIGTLVNPLCRMIEYLKLLCPENEFEITDNEVLNCIIKFIHRNFYNQISNTEIAKACSCSVSTVCHLFKKLKGMSLHKYICDLRLSYAKELLKTSNLSVTSIAHKAGFSDYNYFAIKFKKEFGVSATQYRKNTQLLPE